MRLWGGLSLSTLSSRADERSVMSHQLWFIITQDEYQRYLRWIPAGNAFLLSRQAEFAREVLPTLFRHSNIQSFNRYVSPFEPLLAASPG